MSEYMTTQQVREALEEREALVDEFRQKQDDVNRTGLSLNRAECKKAVEDSLQVERRLDEDLKKRRESLQKQAAAADEFLAKLKDSSGAINRQKLIDSLTSLNQSIYQHALLVVAAKKDNLDFIRNISPGHRAALGIFDHRSIEDRLYNDIAQKDRDIEFMRKEMSAKTKEFDQISAKMASQKQEFDKTLAELATQTHELANVRDEVTALRRQVDEKDKLIQESNTSRDEANRHAGILTDELATKTIEASILANKLEYAERRLSQLDESVPRLKEQIQVSEDNIVVLNENVTSRDERISALNEEITKLETRVVSLEASLQQVSPELENSRHTETLLREQSTIATKAPEAAEARELGIARFFAIQSGWEGAQYSRWLPYIRVVAEADSTIGSNPTPTPLPWVVLETWRSDKEQQLGNYSYSDVVSIACKLYGYALQKETDEEPL
ncbi:hypothetical protein PC116_g27387 [Phytophthora cactorum]|nr:hypothetical protein PC116_g27387 [Phytophthora cactorum]